MVEMNYTEVHDQAKVFFESFNILDMGLIVVIIVALIFLTKYITTRKDEWMLAMIGTMSYVGMTFFANDSNNYLFLITISLIIVFGFIKVLQRMQRNVEVAFEDNG